MTRKILMAAGLFLAVALAVGASMWIWDPLSYVTMPSLRWNPGPWASSAVIGLLAGFVGAAIANYFGIGSRGRTAELTARIERLEKRRVGEGSFREVREAAASPPPPASSRRQEAPASAYQMAAEEGEGARQPAQPAPPVPSRPIIPFNDIVMRYAQVASGHISRSNFAEFFESIGKFRPVEIAEGGRTITVTANEESFLTGVNAGPAILVFPSYDFVANQETQFNTIASVPDDVAAIFELARGDGEIVLDRPAVFDDSATGPTLRSRGEIRGFGG